MTRQKILAVRVWLARLGHVIDANDLPEKVVTAIENEFSVIYDETHDDFGESPRRNKMAFAAYKSGRLAARKLELAESNPYSAKPWTHTTAVRARDWQEGWSDEMFDKANNRVDPEFAKLEVTA
jgi:hypothetical protein